MNSPFTQYELPEERIAAWPAAKLGKRSDSLLLHAIRRKLSPHESLELGESEGDLTVSDKTVAALPEILRPGDLLILNNTKVLPRRYFARSEDDREFELLFLERVPQSEDEWIALARPMKKLQAGMRLQLTKELSATVIGRDESGTRAHLRIDAEKLATLPSDLRESAIDQGGVMPIPPYIRNGRAVESDRTLYQTTYAEIPGSVAAPTAGLHFTPELFEELAARDIETSFITLHVGAPSFSTLGSATLGSEGATAMGEEFYRVPRAVTEQILRAKSTKRRVVAVGTTTVRALESLWATGHPLARSDKFCGTRLFISPGYSFRVVDALMTNFHQPGSTHLLMINAFEVTRCALY